MKRTTLITLIAQIYVSVMISQTVNTGDLIVTQGTILSITEDLNNTSTGTLINNGDVYAYSHWNNNGVVDHDGNGIIRFLGNVPQAITGDNVSYFYDVLFDNETVDTAFELSGEVSIANEVDFDNGIVDTENLGGSIIFEQFADHIHTTDISHVNGRVIKIGDNSFNFPIGDEGLYRFAEISAPDDNDDIFTGKYFFENPDTNYPLESRSANIELINNQEYWLINRDAGSSTILLTLSWEEGTTTPVTLVENPQTALCIVRWDEEEQIWRYEGGLVDPLNKTVTTPIVLEKYGVFTLARKIEEITLPGDIFVNNGITPNGDGVNDYFHIDNIENVANNKVRVFNRWGAEVFSAYDYSNDINAFKGYSDGDLTIGNGLLPTGTYYYTLEYDYTNNGSTQRVEQAGWLYLKTD